MSASPKIFKKIILNYICLLLVSWNLIPGYFQYLGDILVIYIPGYTGVYRGISLGGIFDLYNKNKEVIECFVCLEKVDTIGLNMNLVVLKDIFICKKEYIASIIWKKEVDRDFFLFTIFFVVASHSQYMKIFENDNGGEKV